MEELEKEVFAELGIKIPPDVDYKGFVIENRSTIEQLRNDLDSDYLKEIDKRFETLRNEDDAARLSHQNERTEFIERFLIPKINQSFSPEQKEALRNTIMLNTLAASRGWEGLLETCWTLSGRETESPRERSFKEFFESVHGQSAFDQIGTDTNNQLYKLRAETVHDVLEILPEDLRTEFNDIVGISEMPAQKFRVISFKDPLNHSSRFRKLPEPIKFPPSGIECPNVRMISVLEDSLGLETLKENNYSKLVRLAQKFQNKTDVNEFGTNQDLTSYNGTEGGEIAGKIRWDQRQFDNENLYSALDKEIQEFIHEFLDEKQLAKLRFHAIARVGGGSRVVNFWETRLNPLLQSAAQKIDPEIELKSYLREHNVTKRLAKLIQHERQESDQIISNTAFRVIEDLPFEVRKSINQILFLDRIN